jgi:hypothetical protein
MMLKSWKLDAACATGEYDPDMWFPVQFDSGGAAEAKRVCIEECPVRAECAEYAVNFPMALNGVWGGMSRREIRAERVRRGLKVESEAAFSQLPNYGRKTLDTAGADC